jgi:hypothetical protein
MLLAVLDEATIQKGDRVSHPQKPEWGPGLVAETNQGGKVRVIFVDGGEKLLQLRHAKLEAFDGQDDRLDRLSSDDGASGGDLLGPQRAREKFLSVYPDGCRGDEYQAAERNDKEAASELMCELLSEDALAELLETKNWAEAADRVNRVMAATKLVVPSERKLLREGLEDLALAENFTRALCSLLYGFGVGEGEEEEGMRRRFERYVEALKDLKVPKWSVASYFLFMRFPEEHLLLRPTFVQRAATAFRFELRYKAELNWLSYARLLELGRLVLKDIQDLGARDMFDVQSFIWRITR